MGRLAAPGGGSSWGTVGDRSGSYARGAAGVALDREQSTVIQALLQGCGVEIGSTINSRNTGTR